MCWLPLRISLRCLSISVCTYVCLCAFCVCVCLRVPSFGVFLHVYIFVSSLCVSVLCVYICLPMCLYICLFFCVSLQVSLSICLSVGVCMFICVCVCVCLAVCFFRYIALAFVFLCSSDHVYMRVRSQTQNKWLAEIPLNISEWVLTASLPQHPSVSTCYRALLASTPYLLPLMLQSRY